MKEFEFIEKKELRNKAIERVEVLDKVKKLFLVPNMELMTIGQVAEYYEVEIEAIRSCYKRNQNEINEDGSFMKTSKDFLMVHFEPLKLGQGRVGFQIDSETTLVIPNRGIRCFSKRAVLRIGMLLRDSEVAKEVRTQLLNVFEKTNDEEKVSDIDSEQELYMRFAKAAIEGTKDDLLYTAQEVFEFKNRHIEELKERNSDLEQDNKMLSAEILEWDDRSKINKAVRIIAWLRKIPIAYVWKTLYQELLYKHHIGLSGRGKAPYIQHIRENEWPLVQKSLSAICEEYGISTSKVIWKMKHDMVEKYEADNIKQQSHEDAALLSTETIQIGDKNNV